MFVEKGCFSTIIEFMVTEVYIFLKCLASVNLLV